MSARNINIGNAVKIIALIAVIIGLIWFFSSIYWVIKLTVISLLIVYILDPLVVFLKKRLKLPHPLAVGVTFLAFLLAIIFLISLIVPIVQAEVQAVVSDLPYYMEQFRIYVMEVTELLERFNLGEEYIDAVMERTMDLELLVEDLVHISVSVVASLVDLFFILFIVFYLLYDFHSVMEAMPKLFPAQYETRARDVIRIINFNFGSYMRGNAIRCSVVGLLTGILLVAFGMPYVLLLAILAGLLNFILYIGPFLAAVPAVLLSFSGDTPSVFVVVFIYFFVQSIDAVFLQPIFLSKAVNVKPVTIIISMLIGQQLAGLFGMVLSIPIAGIARSLIDYVKYEQRILPGK